MNKHNQIDREVDVLIVGASLAGASAAKRIVDAGMNGLMIDFKKLPRHKICSGILSPRGHRFLIENFGSLPRETMHEPAYSRGVTFHFPSMVSIPMDFFGGPTPHLYRKFSDYWAVKKSGIEIKEETNLKELVNHGDHSIVTCMTPDGPMIIKARFVIGADGPNSPVRSALYPEYKKSIPWFLVAQKFQEIIECPLDEEYFHFWFHPKLGHYTWSHARDGRQIVGVGFEVGGNVEEYHKRFENYLNEKHGVILKAPDEKEGSSHNFGPSLTNTYVFGKDNVLVTGQASGFFNMLAEGMSCAMHAGAISGESIVEAVQTNRPVQEIYRLHVRSEVIRCSDQWNIFKILFDNPHEADFKTELFKLSTKEQLLVVRDILKFLPIYGRFNWGRKMLRESFSRILSGEYQSSRWI